MDNSALFPHLAPTLKNLLEQRHMSASDLARDSGVSVATLSRLMNGTANPSFENICRLAHALQVSLTTFAPTTPQEENGPNLHSGPSSQASLDHAHTIFAQYEVSGAELTEKSAAALILTAARGQPLPSWVDAYTNPSAPSAEVTESLALGNGRYRISMAYSADMVESGSLASYLGIVASGLTGTHATLTDATIPSSLIRTFSGPAFGLRGLRDTFNKHGRPLLSATLRPMVGLSPRQYARTAFEAMIGGVDMTADPTLLHNLPQNPWRERFRFLAEAALTAGQQTTEYKTHAVNITAATVEDMQERALWAKDLDLATVLVDPSLIGWSALQSLAKWCRNNDMLLCAMGSRPLTNLMISEQLQAKLLRLAGADVVSTGSPLRGNLSNRHLQAGVMNALRGATTDALPDEGHPLPQSYNGIAAALPAVGGGHNPWHFPRLVDAVGDDTIFQCGGSIVSHPWGSQAGAIANRTALEATIQARNEGLNLNVEQRTILQRAAKYSPELKEALNHWQEGSFLFGVIQGSGEKNTPTEGKIIAPSPQDNVTLFKRPTPENTED